MFSIVTPTRNSLEKLKQCVGSVRGQTGVELEHIIQDAVSTDGTPEWLVKQPDLSSLSEPDDGMYDAINRGWSKSRGEILSWLNSDEQYLPGTLAYVQSIFEKNPDVDFIFGNAHVVNRKGDPIAAKREIRLSHRYISNSFLNAFSCTLFFRRRLWDEGFLQLNSDLRYAADMELILRLLEERKSSLKLNCYLSLFGLDGTNLSCQPGMLSETALLQRQFGGFNSLLLRRAVTLGRYVERLFVGAYRPQNVEYDFALDEIPTYRKVQKYNVPGSYRTYQM